MVFRYEISDLFTISKQTSLRYLLCDQLSCVDVVMKVILVVVLLVNACLGVETCKLKRL